MTPEDELARVIAIGYPSTPRQKMPCPQCDGVGTLPTSTVGDTVVCATCHGAGKVATETPLRPNA